MSEPGAQLGAESVSGRWYFKLRRVASFMPEPVPRWLIPRWKLAEDPSDGWTFWLDAAIERHDRREQAARR